MRLANWIMSDGIGFSKKHDAPPPSQHMNTPRIPWTGMRRRRLVLIVVALAALFLFVKNIPTPVGPRRQRYNSGYSTTNPDQIQAIYGQPKSDTAGQQHEGPLAFHNLVATLRPHYSRSDENNNILFALPEIGTVSNLVPLACQMAQNNRSSVHVALLGRSTIGVQRILSLNGISARDCPVIWHDARPDRALESSESRNIAGIQAGFGHCCVALRPQVVLVDEHTRKDSSVGKLLHQMAASTGTVLVAVPTDPQQSVSWISTLDGSSLRQFHDVDIEIIIQAYAESAGPLIRLLRSIEAADYRGLFLPRLTIELPTQVDPLLLDHLQRFQWPPGSSPAESKLTLRHRIRTTPSKANESSIRMIESFYPRVPSTSHILLLSPDVELSPSYLKYLLFTLLEYRYGRDHQSLSASLFGISLDLPSTKLSDLDPFLDLSSAPKTPLVLSQTPNNNAALVLGDKWVELHTFLGHRLTRDAELSQKSEMTQPITHEYPEWLTEALDLMQARGYFMLYPAFADKTSLKLVVRHQELHQSPEEYAHLGSVKEAKSFDASELMSNDVLTGDMEHLIAKDRLPPTDASLPLQVLLTSGGKRLPTLPKLADLPTFTYTGKLVSWPDFTLASTKFADDFSLGQGGCKTLEARDQAKRGLIDFLFCEVS